PLVDLPRVVVAGGEGVEAVADGGGRLRLLPPDLAGQGDYGGGVQATAETTARPHVAVEVLAQRRQEQLFQPRYPFLVRLSPFRPWLQPPVAAHGQAPGVQVQGKGVGRGEGLDL